MSTNIEHTFTKSYARNLFINLSQDRGTTNSFTMFICLCIFFSLLSTSNSLILIIIKNERVLYHYFTLPSLKLSLKKRLSSIDYVDSHNIIYWFVV